MRGYVPKPRLVFSAEAFYCNWDIPVLGRLRLRKEAWGLLKSSYAARTTMLVIQFCCDEMRETWW
jgi:hypothetical protein